MLYPSKLEVFKKLHAMEGNGGHEVIARDISAMSLYSNKSLKISLLALRGLFKKKKILSVACWEMTMDK